MPVRGDTVKIVRSPRKANILDPGKREEGRALIAEKAFPLFLKFGYHVTSVRSIADAAGMSVGSIFNYFEAKEEILQYILDRYQGFPEAALLEAERQLTTLDGSKDPQGIFVSLYRRYVAQIQDIAPFTLLAYQETKNLTSEKRAPLFARELRVVDLLMRAARPGIAAGIFSAEGLELKIHWLVMLAHAWAIRGWALGRYRPEEYRRELESVAVAVLKAGTTGGCLVAA